jgi:serine/threonine-protein kinase ULK/ATG1
MNGRSEKNIFKSLGKYTLITNDYLGTGAYGKVYRAFYDGDPKKVVAIKEIHYKMAQKEKEDIFIKTCQQEIQELQQLKSNKHIVQLYDVITTSDTFYLIMEYCNQGNLKKFRENKKLSEEEVLYLFQQIIEGFKFIRKLNKIHRDIKPENILVHNNVLKIADFQFARTLLDEEYAFTYAGTDAYMAPEVIEGDYIDK